MRLEDAIRYFFIYQDSNIIMTEENNRFFKRLDELQERYETIEKQISDPAIAVDSARVISLSKEQARLKDIVGKYRRYRDILSGIEDAREILGDESAEEDFRGLAEEEKNRLEGERDRLMEEIKNILVMAGDDKVDSIIMEIRPGTGGGEATIFARDLYNMYMKYMERRGWKSEQLEFSPSEIGGLREAIFSIKGPGVWTELGYEGGTHRVQRVPVTESQGRIHTSAATVAVLPEPEELDIRINPEDVTEHVSRSSGPGGQNVNKVSSAVRLEHAPTGITVSMQDEQSQHKNRAKAWRVLRSRVYQYYESRERAQRDSLRKDMIGSGDRSQKIRTYNYPQNRVTDHRINLSIYSLDKVMAGELGELISALQDYDREQRLEQL